MLAVRIQIQSESERERQRERVLWLVFCRPLGLLGSMSPQSSDLVDLANRTTSRSPAAMGEWRSGALGGALRRNGGRLGPILCNDFIFL